MLNFKFQFLNKKVKKKMQGLDINLFFLNFSFRLNALNFSRSSQRKFDLGFGGIYIVIGCRRDCIFGIRWWCDFLFTLGLLNYFLWKFRCLLWNFLINIFMLKFFGYYFFSFFLFLFFFFEFLHQRFKFHSFWRLTYSIHHYIFK